MIKILDSFVSDKIAAGEVIERPLSIIKELIENSIDAGASQIIVEIRNGGKSYIRVSDNGSGIPSDEVELAFERHATGKISGLTDLSHIETLGFRGEALASIAAISRVTIFSRTKDGESGVKLVMYGGKKMSLEAAGVNTGTTIVVEDVFYNTPARRKFMKSDAAEASVVISLVQKLAVYYAGISFRLINNGQTALSTSGDGSFRNAISSVFPSAEYANLLEISGPAVSGYISDPGTTKNNRRGQLFFVNGRIVSSETIEKGVIDGYGGRIFSGHPIAILFVTVDPEKVDVNIHPAKQEVKFLEQENVRRSISEAVSGVMNTENSVPRAAAAEKGLKSESPRDGETASYTEPVQAGIRDILKLREHVKPEYTSLCEEQHTDNTKNATSDDSITGDENAAPIELAQDANPLFDFDDLSVKGYVFNAYIITQAGDALYILDQHAAHERIMYEKLVGRYNSRERQSQPVLTPYTIDVSADIYNGERAFLTALQRMGYDIEDFGVNTFILREIPLYMNADEAVSFAADYIEGAHGSDGDNTAVIDKLIMRSCKAAVKANDVLSNMEIGELLEKLSDCINPFSCPHGRPTFVKITKYDIERSFKRK